MEISWNSGFTIPLIDYSPIIIKRMNHFFKSVIAVFAIFSYYPLNILAYDVEIAGIYYNLNTNKKTAEVTYFANDDTNMAKYQGDINIPATIEYNNETYNVLKIGNYAFKGCVRLNSVTIPEGVTHISNSFFGCKGLKSVNIPSTVIDIQSLAFYNCSSLTSITLPEGLTEIKDCSFQYCSSLQTIVLPSSIVQIGAQAFYGCSSLTEFQIPDGVTSISQALFWNCSNLTKVVIPSSVSTIGIGAFYNCKNLLEIDIPQQVVNIPQSAFSGCSSLTSIVIPQNVIQIDKDAFYKCIGLTTIICEAIIPPCCYSSTFYGVEKANCKLLVPEGSVDTYKNEEYWNEFYDISDLSVLETEKPRVSKYSLQGYKTNTNNGLTIIKEGETYKAIFLK